MANPYVEASQGFLGRRIQQLNDVLQEQCPYVDREALGYWCGLPGPWWLPDAGLADQDYFRLLRQLHDNEVPNIALRVAAKSRISDLDVIGYAMMASRTLEQALRLSMSVAEQSYGFVKVGLTVDREHALLSCEVLPAGSDYYQLLLEEWMVTIWQFVRSILPEGLAACASYATLNYKAPTYHWEYQRILGCRVSFDQPLTVLAIPKQWLYTGINRRDAQAQSLYESQVKRLLKNQLGRPDIVTRVKRMLVERPAQCRFQLETTAPLLSLSSRTLRRQLAVAGTSFREVSLEVRMELAQDYLLNSQLTAQEVAYQLGYSQPNNFFRAFRSFYGMPPERFRTEHRIPRL
ncbi:AraC family transcriptional regulator [Pseudomaricurvus sp. HS19]|uniref:helix-turn-helix domain-containing protein n=1 Tax=Pseudomaricurvus sp. HS19 TaxID=2692626 RepID=UPI001367E370|nr:AraC family transcriptional regulator [Pseudomaricurvus sp. HS19]MYM61970.1 helix-turn-helix domain-containing protein [Pseudomaricurvus sp. HS19]